MHHLTSEHFPFAAIVGQDRLKLSLLLNAVHPAIGGVLIRGERGTAKSTAARALAELLPDIEVVESCPFHCHPEHLPLMCDDCAARYEAGEALPRRSRPAPFTTLPLGATEDRVVGTIDVEQALSTGRVRLKPGLLAEAHRGVLYVDEVNLLDDHLVDVLLDAAATGRNTVEREGLSAVHPARFILVGTMNPEEGELRPQLLDRFGLAVDVAGLVDLGDRVEVLERLTEWDRDPHGMIHRFQADQDALQQRVADARERLLRLSPDRSVLEGAARRALDSGVDGHRADAAMVKVALALAAWNGEAEVTGAHLDEAMALVLPHRQRRRPFEPPGAGGTGETGNGAGEAGGPEGGSPSPEEPVHIEAALPPARAPGRRTGQGGAPGGSLRGKKVGVRPREGDDEPVDVAASLMAAAVRQPARGRATPEVHPRDLRTPRISGAVQRAVCFLVDASGSMGARGRIEAARQAARSLLVESYQGRLQVALVLLSGGEAHLAVPLTRDPERTDRALAEVQTGGRTPLAHGLELAGQVLRRSRERGMSPTLVVISDGRANWSRDGSTDPAADALAAARDLAEAGVDGLIVDTEDDVAALGVGRDLAEVLGAVYVASERPGAGPILRWLGRSG